MTSGRKWLTFGASTMLAVLAMILASCGEASEVSTGSGDDPDDVVPELSDAAGEEAADVDADVDGVDKEGGLTLRLTGELSDGLLCPGGQRPCFALDRQPAVDENGRVQVTGRLIDGVVIIDSEEEPPPGPTSGFPNECEGKNAGGGDREEVFQALDGYRQSILDRYAIQWVSRTNVFHFGVVGDAADVAQAIADLGLGDDICVVGGFLKSEAELLAVSDEVAVVVNQWMEEGPMDSMGWAPDPFVGAVSMDVFRIDADMAASLASIGDGAVVVNASIEVLDGSLEDLEAAMNASPASAPVPDVTMTCGPITFPDMPVDLDGLTPLDADAEAALQAALDGPAGGEAIYFVDEHTWSIASRTETELQLFGKPIGAAGAGEGPGAEARYAYMSFSRAGDEWSANGFGGCRLEVSALGLGPATVILDPDREPDPTSNELPVLIRERDCSGGQAPVDREIVPVVAETDTTVELIVLVAPVVGGATCPGNPLHPIVVTLEQPLGDRTVIDAGTQPGAVRSWPPNREELDG